MGAKLPNPPYGTEIGFPLAEPLFFFRLRVLRLQSLHLRLFPVQVLPHRWHKLRLSPRCLPHFQDCLLPCTSAFFPCYAGISSRSTQSSTPLATLKSWLCSFNTRRNSSLCTRGRKAPSWRSSRPIWLSSRRIRFYWTPSCAKAGDKVGESI